jgi:plastocyanin
VRLAAIACMLAASTVAHAGGGIVRGVVEANRPKEVEPGPILVYVVGFTEPAPRAPVVVKQIGKRFIPDLVAVTAGGTVSFPNGDPFLHNVFSRTSARAFDLGSFKQGEARGRTFPSPGVVDVYCNLHPEMSATLVILPNTRFAIADAAGRFEIASVPAGKWKVFAFSRHAAQPASTTVEVASGAAAEITLRLDEVQRDFNHRNKYGETYRATSMYPPGS